MQFFERRKKTTELHRACIVEQILNGLNYLHNQNVAHRYLLFKMFYYYGRDLTAESIIFQDKRMESGKPIIKIVDYGLIKLINNGVNMAEYVGTPYYMPPEILN